MTRTSAHSIAVRCQGVTKNYGAGDAEVLAQRGVDLEVPRGQLLMLVGPSGCGKTTLISIITATAGWGWLIFIGMSGVLGFAG